MSVPTTIKLTKADTVALWHAVDAQGYAVRAMRDMNREERTLTLPLKGIYFDQIKRGEKLREFRLVTPFWRKRLQGQRYDRIVLTRGYPPRDDAARRLVLPWQGYRMQTLQHEHFGPAPVEVFAIDVSGVPLNGGTSNSPPGGSTA